MSLITSVLDVAGLGALLDALSGRGYVLLGPTVRDGAVVLSRITSIADLPTGVRDEQAPGRYRLESARDGLLFGFAATAASWKPYLFPARRTLWELGAEGLPEQPDADRTRRAFVGVRSCDLHAIGVLDDVLAARPFGDPDYAARREGIFVVAVTCTHPGGTCFCAAMGTGPRPDAGFDVALTEIMDDDGHRFLAEPGSVAGAGVLAEVPSRPATRADEEAARALATAASEAMGRSVATEGLRDLLYARAEDPRWDDVAARCLSCGNCTLVCPTCFCVAPRDVAELSGRVRRDREWDSCFDPEHSHLHGGPVRASTRARYRQWLTHKFASWIDQFGTSGCVGCGRCVTWCPVGIDVREELAALRASTSTEEGFDGPG
ncbi:MAG: 4Fe-4S dicluster domain-containing protein [Kineosporiaceae bacterium]